MMRHKRRGLTPFKVILVFLIAFILVSIHEMDRIVGWLEGAALESGSDSQFLNYCSKGRETVANLGLDKVVEAEKRLLTFTENLPVIGAMVTKTDSDVLVGARFVTKPIESWDYMAAVGSMFADPMDKADRTENQPVRTASGNREIPSDIQAEPPADREMAVLPEESRPLQEETVAPAIENPPVEKPEIEAASVAPEKFEIRKPESKIHEKLKPKTILIAGDSMILEGFGVALERKLKKLPGLEVVRKGKYSSGLSRPDYFDWIPYLKELLDEHKPDLLVVCLGANDPQDILDENHKRHFVATKTWNEIYARRADAFLNIAGDAGAAVIWVGLPIMGKETYGKRIKNLNEVVEKVCDQRPDCLYIDSWRVLANDKGKYTTFIKTEDGRHIRIRAKDKIHLTESGGRLLVAHVMTEASGFIELPKAADGIETAAARQQGETNQRLDF